MHALLAAAVVFIGWPTAVQCAGVLAVVGHGLLRRPAKSPRLVLVAEGGACAVPEWQTGLRPLGPRTIVAPFWVRLDLGKVASQRELLLTADQLGHEDWRHLRALLARARGD